MTYNKSRNIEAAQKYLHQGKIAQAIGEYQQMLKQEPKDQVTLMTVGDLFVRQGETFQALEYFERLAQIFLAEGFVSKAIAVYKKIAKLAPEETRPVERLAELYVQQGVLSEARPIYLQLAELHQRAGRQQQAVGLLRKLLEAEPDNLRVRVRLAELALTTGETADAVAAFRTAAELLHRRGDHAEAIKYADRALKADPDDLPTLALKARMLAAGSHRSDAIALLQSLPALDEGGETSDLLIDLYMEAGEDDAASELAAKIFAHNPTLFTPAHHVAVAFLESDRPDRALALLGLIREAETDAGNHEQLSEALTRAAEKLPSSTEPREWLVEHYGRTSDSFRLSDAQVSLAEAYEANGNSERAEQIYKQILERSPENEQVRRKVARLQNPGGRGIEAEEEVPAESAPGLQAQEQEAAPAEPVVDEETQRYVTQALTDVDLFSSYGLTQKAIELLEALLERAPGQVTALERLLDLYLGAGNERRTEELAAQLQEIHRGRGDASAADRFGDLQRRYGKAADLSEENAAPAAEADWTAELPIRAVEAEADISEEAAPASLDEAMAELSGAQVASEPGAGATASADGLDEGIIDEGVVDEGKGDEGIVEEEILGEVGSQEGVREVDLSEEWATLAKQFAERSVHPPLEIPQPLQETESEGIEENAPAPEVPAAASTISPEPALPAATEEFAIPSAPPAPDELAAEEFSVEPPPEYELELDSLPSALAADEEELSTDDLLRSLSADFADAMPDIVPGQAARHTPEAWPPAEPAETGAEEPALVLQDAAPAEAAEVQGPLTEVFEEFRAGLDDVGSNGEDLETHYNLGVAYREMGLLDEAISEFQKVAKGSKKGEAFRYAMQCCTLLGLAFMEKSQPSIAAMWYLRALEIPGLDQESILALRYDLGVAQELAGDTSAARQSFSQVYGVNIDYRDVAERLAALGKGR